MAAKVITITSGKGGVGKTTATANLGAFLSELGKKVILVDGDIGLRNLDLVLGLENRVVYTLVDVLQGSCKLKQALVKDKRFKNLYLLPAAQNKDKDAVDSEAFNDLVIKMKPMADFIIIDSPAGIERGFRNAISPADEVLIVTVPEVSAIRDADRIVGLLEANAKEKYSLIINRIRPKMVNKGEMLGVEDIREILSIPIIGIVPEDENIIVSTNRGNPVIFSKGSKAGEAFRNIARRILGENVPFLDLEEKQGLWAAIYSAISGFVSKGGAKR